MHYALQWLMSSYCQENNKEVFNSFRYSPAFLKNYLIYIDGRPMSRNMYKFIAMCLPHVRTNMIHIIAKMKNHFGTNGIPVRMGGRLRTVLLTNLDSAEEFNRVPLDEDHVV